MSSIREQPRLTAQELAANFAELKPPLGQDEAAFEAARCLYCYDAPCTRACPTHIDVPAFIKKIASHNLRGSARVILEANILGASCARVCPTEVLCEGACVLNGPRHRPIPIGRLQRLATDFAMARGRIPIEPGTPNGKSVAVIGAGPAGLGCAAELVRLGYAVTVYESSPQAGGLNTYGVADYKMDAPTALAEVKWITELGIEIRTRTEVGKDVPIAELERTHQAVFLGIGLGKIRPLGIPGDDLPGVVDALDLIAALKTGDKQSVKVGRRVAVIGGGNTSIDAVTQSVRLGAQKVWLLYRRGPAEMRAYLHEQELARADGVEFIYNAVPERIVPAGDALRLECRSFALDVDMVVRAIGQDKRTGFLSRIEGLTLEDGRIVVDETGRTTNPRYWAGGDAANGGKEVVNAVAEGKKAAHGIHRALSE